MKISAQWTCIELIIATYVNVTGSHLSNCGSVAKDPGLLSIGDSQFLFDTLVFDNCLFTNTGPIYFHSNTVRYPIPTHTLVQNCDFVEPRLPIADIQTWGSSASFLNLTVGAPGSGSKDNSTYLQVASNQLTIDGCSFDGAGAERIVQVDGTYSPKLTEIKNSAFKNTRNCSLFIEDVPHGREHHVQNCQFVGFGGAGICYSSSYNDSSKPFVPLTVDSCTFSDAPGGGMLLAGSARVSGCSFDRVSRGITTNTSLSVVISGSSFKKNDDVALAAGGDPVHTALVKIDNLSFDHCTPWAVNCTNQVAILLSNPSSLSFNSGSAADNINTKTCEVRPALLEPAAPDSPSLPSWAIVLIVIAGLVVIALPVILLLALLIVTVIRRRRKDEFEFEFDLDGEDQPY